MKNLFIIICFIFITSCNSTKKTSENKTVIDASTEISSTKTAPIQAMVEAYSKINNDAGVILLKQSNGKSSIYSAGYANAETKEKVNENYLFEIGSASKLFTAIAIMQLIEDGKLSLNTKVSTLYPTGNIQKLAEQKGENYWDKVTVQMLLNHTTGFIDYLNAYGDEETLRLFNNSKKQYSFNDIINLSIEFGDASFIPDSKFGYSNTNYIILGDIISKISKTPWRTYIEEYIFKKADLKNTFFGSKMSQEQKERLATGYYNKQITNIPYTLAGSAGSIVSNVYDLQKFITYWADAKFYKNSDTFNKQITTGVHNMYPGTDMLQYALGVFKLGGTVGHPGQTFGFQSHLAIDPITKNSYIILVNNAKASSTELLMELLELEKRK